MYLRIEPEWFAGEEYLRNHKSRDKMGDIKTEKVIRFFWNILPTLAAHKHSADKHSYNY